MGLMRSGKTVIVTLLLATLGLKMLVETLIVLFPYLVVGGVILATYGFIIGRTRF